MNRSEERPLKLTSVISEKENPEGIDNALRILAGIMVRHYLAEKKKLETSTGAAPAAAPAQALEGQRLLDVDGLATYLSLTKATIYTWVSLKRIPERAIVRLGRALRFDVKEIDVWIESQRAGGRMGSKI